MVAAQAFSARANANWAGAAYRAGRGAGRRLAGALAGQGVDRRRAWPCQARWSALLPGLRDSARGRRTAMGLANGFKRAKGWETAGAGASIARARGAGQPALTAVAVDDRFLFNAAAYYGRDYSASRARRR